MIDSADTRSLGCRRKVEDGRCGVRERERERKEEVLRMKGFVFEEGIRL